MRRHPTLPLTMRTRSTRSRLRVATTAPSPRSSSSHPRSSPGEVMALPPVAARPYPWPFDGRWSPADTALVIIDMQTDFLKAGGYCDQMGLDVGLTSAAIAPARSVLARMRELGFS